MTRKLLLGLVLLIIAGAAAACPEGQQPAGNPTTGNPSGCVPYAGSQQSQPSAPQVIWETRWGAIATDVVRGKLGSVVGMPNKRKAQQVAISQCRANGGTKCTVDIAYYNQCAVMIVGSKKYNTSSAATLEEATRNGMQTCNASDTNCRVYYADCSFAERVQ